MTIRSYRDLRVWESAMQLVDLCYDLTAVYPDHERYGLTSQTRRAAVSVPTNIAEGHAGWHRKEFAQGVSIALGSLAELETLIEIAERRRYARPRQVSTCRGLAERVGRQLHALQHSLRQAPIVRASDPEPRVPGPEPAPGPRPLAPGPRTPAPNLQPPAPGRPRPPR